MATSAVPSEPLRLVTLGDAYTAGTHTLAPKRDSWPAQLVAAMEDGDVRLRLVDNLADSGQTSEDVMRSQLPQLDALVPDVVTLQVGVNDIIARDISLDDYRRNVTAIVDQLLLDLAPGRIFLITTPDHTITARGADWGSRESGHADVMASHAILEEVATQRGVTLVDIGPVNRLATQDASLVIGEGPYPTAKQYAGWVEIIGPAMRRVLTSAEP
jgi:lysophospholipase L1-like esterase